MRFISYILSCICTTLLAIQPTNVLPASTHCVEVVITKSSLTGDETEVSSDGKGHSFTGQITFTNYLSSPAVATPQDSRTFSAFEAWTPTTGFSLMDVTSPPSTGAPLQTVGREMFIYNSRSKAIFRSMSLLPFPTIGELVEHDGNSLVTRRLITQ